MTRKLSKKRSEAKAEYGGYENWLRDELNLSQDVDISARRTGSYSNVSVMFEFPGGDEVIASGYFSQGIVPYYKLTLTNEQVRRIKELRADPAEQP